MGIMDHTYSIRFLREKDFKSITSLGDKIFGKDYITEEEMEVILKRSLKDGRNCSFTLYFNEGDGTLERLIGFRLTYAPGTWIEDYPLELHPEEWGPEPSNVAYFKCNALEEEFRGKAFGRMLLDKSVGELRRMGAVAGVCHIRMNSPGNSAFKYFRRAGGKLIRTYEDYWVNYHNEDKPCIKCGAECQCSGSEMLLDLTTHKELGHV